MKSLEDEISTNEPIRIANENERISQENARQEAERERQGAIDAQVKQGEAWAVGTRGGVPVESGDETYHNNSKYYSEMAGDHENAAGEYSEKSEAYAVGKRNGVDVPDTDETYHNNSKYYRDQAAAIMAELDGTIRAQGTCLFDELPDVSDARPGDMWNISDEFVTTSDFREGSGKRIPEGANVYMTTSSKWDIMAGAPVTGVKGAAETEYRKGNVNITYNDLGIETKPMPDTTNPVQSEGVYKTISGIVPMENYYRSDREYSVGDEFLFNEKMCRAVQSIGYGDRFILSHKRLIGRLTLINNFESITKVVIDDTTYSSVFTNMSIYENSTVTLYHAKTRGWEYYDPVQHAAIILGGGEACNFMVPPDAEGDAQLYIYDGHTVGGMDGIDLEESTNWAMNIEPELGEGGYIGDMGNYIVVDDLGKQVGALNTKTTAEYQNKEIPFRFGIDADGNYGYYKDGADTVTPFKTVVDLGTGTSFNVSNITGYKKFTKDNFYIVCTSASGSSSSIGKQNGQWWTPGDGRICYDMVVNYTGNTASATIGKTYNQSTGVLTLSNMSASAGTSISGKVWSGDETHAYTSASGTVGVSIGYYVLLIY